MMYLFLLGRVLFGGFFIMSGFKHFKELKSMAGYATSKGVPMANIAVMGTGALMLFGGLGVLFGVREVIALWMLVICLVGITPTMHAYWKDTDPMQKMGNRINFYKNIALIGALLMLLALHSGTIATWSLL